MTLLAHLSPPMTPLIKKKKNWLSSHLILSVHIAKLLPKWSGKWFIQLQLKGAPCVHPQSVVLQR